MRSDYQLLHRDELGLHFFKLWRVYKLSCSLVPQPFTFASANTSTNLSTNTSYRCPNSHTKYSPNFLSNFTTVIPHLSTVNTADYYAEQSTDCSSDSPTFLTTVQSSYPSPVFHSVEKPLPVLLTNQVLCLQNNPVVCHPEDRLVNQPVNLLLSLLGFLLLTLRDYPLHNPHYFLLLNQA
jgi:hypothetical protein